MESSQENAIKILVADSDSPLRILLGHYLTRLGYTVLTAKNGHEVVSLARKGNPDLIILEIIFPDFNGLEACRLLKSDEATCDIPIIFLSAQNDLETKITAFSIGADDFLSKPFEPRELELRIAVILRHKQRREDINSLTKNHSTPHSSIAQDRAESDRRNVFVVHGRNLQARKSLFGFLRSLKLNPIEWSQAIKATGKASPFIGEILDVAFSTAQAVIVLMTPDDEAWLREPLRNPNDPAYESHPTGQARPNVLFEAGMAMARDPERTIIVELGTVRPFSDIAGRHTIKLSNDSAARHELAQRLETAGCPVDLSGRDWHTEGDFTLQLTSRQTVSNASQEVTATASEATTKGKAADRKLFEELKQDLPSSGSIAFIRDFNMAGFAFNLKRLDELYNFIHRWNDVEHEFLDEELEEKRSHLHSLIEEYTNLIAYNTFPLRNDLQTVPPEWEDEQPERFHKVVNQLHDKAGEIVTAHQDLIRTARHKLDV